jgi:rhodanese-related sulfurtransferase
MVSFLNIQKSTLAKLSGLMLLATSLAGCFEPPPYTNLDNEQLQAMLQQGTPLIDIRRQEEWRETGVVANSKLMTFVDANGRVTPGFLETFSASVGKDDPVILICRTGNRTDALARHLVTKMGYTQVYNVRNGITDWIQDGLPVARSNSGGRGNPPFLTR